MHDVSISCVPLRCGLSAQETESVELPNIEYMLNLMATRDMHKRGSWGVLIVRQNRQQRSIYPSIQSSKRNDERNKKGRRLIGDCNHDINIQGVLNRGHSVDWIETDELNIFSIELKKLRLHCGWKDMVSMKS